LSGPDQNLGDWIAEFRARNPPNGQCPQFCASAGPTPEVNKDVEHTSTVIEVNVASERSERTFALLIPVDAR
jgi:hypothetical protein